VCSMLWDQSASMWRKVHRAGRLPSAHERQSATSNAARPGQFNARSVGSAPDGMAPAAKGYGQEGENVVRLYTYT
jgi:hypothetical protein